MATFSYTLSALGSNQTANVAGQEELLLGKDIYWDGDYNVHSAGDYVLLSGLNALRQAVYRRLVTRPGEFKLRPEYGVGVQEFIKKRQVSSTFSVLRQRIIDQLSFDDRIEEVLDVVIESIQDGIKIGVVIRASGEALKFEPFNFRAGDTIGTLTNASGALRIG